MMLVVQLAIVVVALVVDEKDDAQAKGPNERGASRKGWERKKGGWIFFSKRVAMSRVMLRRADDDLARGEPTGDASVGSTSAAVQRPSPGRGGGPDDVREVFESLLTSATAADGPDGAPHDGDSEATPKLNCGTLH